MTTDTFKIKSPLNWSNTSEDYLNHRPGYPTRFFTLLKELGIGLPMQRILDLGAGTGALSIPFAQQGAFVTAVDPASGQIEAAKKRAQAENLKVRFIVSAAEIADVEKHFFDIATASMCWGYIDTPRIIEKLKLVLNKSGLLMLSSLIWSSKNSEIAMQTDKLINRFNNRSSKHTNRGNFDIIPDWSKVDFNLKTYHHFVENLPFTRNSWRGRIRASKWIGAALPQDLIEEFDNELEILLERNYPESFEIPHDIRIQIFELKE